MYNRQMIKLMANNYNRWLCEESFKTPLLVTNFIFEFRKRIHLLLSFAWTLTRPTNFNLSRQNIVFSYSQRISVSFSWLIDYFSFFFCYFTLLLIFIQIILLLLFYYIFFHENYFYFFMFRDVPGCSGMFRYVPECSVFRVLSTAVVEASQILDVRWFTEWR